MNILRQPSHRDSQVDVVFKACDTQGPCQHELHITTLSQETNKSLQLEILNAILHSSAIDCKESST